MANESSKKISLETRKMALLKKVRELTILCDVQACIAIFSPNEAEPVVWPSKEAASSLFDNYFALPNIERKMKQMTVESYLEKKISNVKEKLKKIHKEKVKYLGDQLMLEVQSGRKLADLNSNEIDILLSFSKDKMMQFSTELNLVQHPPPRDPPVHSHQAQSEDIRTTINNDFTTGDIHNDVEAQKTVSIGTMIKESQNRYLMDQWIFPSSETHNSLCQE